MMFAGIFALGFIAGIGACILLALVDILRGQDAHTAVTKFANKRKAKESDVLYTDPVVEAQHDLYARNESVGRDTKLSDVLSDQ